MGILTVSRVAHKYPLIRNPPYSVLRESIKTMNLLLAIGLGAFLFLVVVGIHKIAMWMQGREEKQLKGK